MEKGQGKGTDTLQTNNVFTHKEYIEREKALKFKLTANLRHEKITAAQAVADAIAAYIESIPAADVVPVVRCGECKHWYENGTDLCSCDRDALLRRRDFFCADGERKDGDGHG